MAEAVGSVSSILVAIALAVDLRSVVLVTRRDLAHTNRRPKKPRHKKSAADCSAALLVRQVESNYFETDFLNIRSIFSFVASQQAWLA